jgi:hypothetical protein
MEVDRATFLTAITDDAVVHSLVRSFAGTTNPPTILTLLTQSSCLKRGETAKPRLGCLKIGLCPDSPVAVSWQKTMAAAPTR